MRAAQADREMTNKISSPQPSPKERECSSGKVRRTKDEGRKEGRRKDEQKTKERRTKDEERTNKRRRKDEGRTKNEGRNNEG